METPLPGIRASNLACYNGMERQVHTAQSTALPAHWQFTWVHLHSANSGQLAMLVGTCQAQSLAVIHACRRAAGAELHVLITHFLWSAILVTRVCSAPSQASYMKLWQTARVKYASAL